MAMGFYVSMTIGRPVGEKVEKLVESVNESASCSCGCGTCSEAVNEGKDFKRVKKDKYGNHLEPQFKKGDKVTYLGNKGVITNVNKEMGGAYSYDVSYDKGSGKTKASNIFNKDGKTLQIESVNEEETFTATNKETGKTSVFKSKDARDAAVKAGTHADKDDIDGDTSQDKEKPNMFSKDTGYDAGGDSEPKKKTGLKGFIQKMRDKQKEKELADRRYPDFKKNAIIVSAIDKNGEKQEWMTKMSREEITDHMNQKVEDGEAKSYQLMRFNYYYRPVPIDESVNEAATDRDFEKVYSIFDKKDYFNAKGLAKVQIGNFERALQRNDKGAQQILDKFNGDMEKSKEYIIQVISDQKKAQAFEDYKALKAAVDSIQKGNPITGAVDLVKSRAHNNTQKYTMALYSALRGKKFNNYKDIHADVDSLIGESITEGRAFINAARKAKEEGKSEFEFNGKTYPVTLKEETINERRLGKVSLLKSVEDGETSRVEGVKISPDLAFELRMFLQRPMLARTRTGIAIDNAQMKDAIVMLAKVGIHKRLSSGVKKEFADLLKKYK